LRVTVPGSGFTPDAVAAGGSASPLAPFATTFVSATEISAVIPAAFLSQAGSFKVAVTTNGITTPAAYFLVTGSAPVLTE
jgi:hypothetical protein